jgi:UDP-2,4-diacetamido-2,4,6-trideoxy-beta-L-altropyranose hydrolase
MAATLPAVTLRRATPADARLIFGWANDPADRASSFDPTPIPWDDHVRWYARKLADPTVYLFVGHDGDGRPVGQVRLEVTGATTVASVGVAPEYRGRGYGSALIAAGVRELVKAGSRTFYADVLAANHHSLRAFHEAGFRLNAPAGSVRLVYTADAEVLPGSGGWVGW